MYTELKRFSEKAVNLRTMSQNESQTRTFLIDPILKILGYDTTNPFEVVPEFNCDVGIKKGEKIDYALMRGSDVFLLIEAKDCKLKLTDRHIGQLFRYFSVSSAKIGLLTNGLDYLFFTDTIKQNVMDTKPFFSFNILDFTDRDAKVFSMFAKNNVDYEKIRNYALASTFFGAFLEYFDNQTISPTPDFTSHLKKNIEVEGISEADINKYINIGLKAVLGDNILTRISIPNILIDDSNTDDTTSLTKLTGLVTLQELTIKNCAGTKPTELSIKGKQYGVSTWSEVLIATLMYCLYRGKTNEFILNLGNENSNSRNWVGVAPEGMRSPKEVPYIRLFVDTHGSSWDIIKRVKFIVAKLGVPLTDVFIKMKD